MSKVLTTTSPKNEIKRLGDALAKISITLPEAVTTTPERVRVEEPSSREIGEAIRDAKDPLNDETVQRLMLAHQIARGGFESAVLQAGWAEQRQALNDARATINDQLHARFDEAAHELTEVAPKLTGRTELESLILSNLPAREVEPARRAIEAQATLRATLRAWRTLWAITSSQTLGRPNTQILQACNPSPDQWFEHASRQPNSLPAPGDVWGIVQRGWTLDLAHNPKAAIQRDKDITHAIDRQRHAQQLATGRARGWGARM